MTSGFGVDATADGTSGTTSLDIRRMNRALYTPGIISGVNITPSSNSMHYAVSAGVVAIETVKDQELILAPVDATLVPASAPPASGARTDIIYVKQRFPSVDGDANVNIIALPSTTAAPANSLVIGKYVLTSGISNTAAAQKVGDRDFAIPYGANLGVLYEWINTYSGPISIPLLREGHGKIHVPTDRRVRFSISTCLNAQGASGFDNSKYCEWFFLPNIDGGDMVIWTTDGLHQAWATYNFEHYQNVTAGTHDVSIGCGRMVGPGQAIQHHGVDGQGYGRIGLRFLVEDAGPIK